MKSVRLFSLSAVGFLALTVAAPGFAKDGCDYGRSVVTRLVEMVMAEDKTALVDSLVALEPELDTARSVMEEADLKLSESKNTAAGALLSVLYSEGAVDEAKTVYNRAALEVAGAQAELKDLLALPKSQETNSDIAFVKAELATLQRFTAGAGSDLLQAMRRLKLAQSETASAETFVARAEDEFLLEKQDFDSVHERINAAHRAFDEERANVETALAALSRDQRVTLDRSLTPSVNDDFVQVDIDAEHLRMIHGEAYSVRQVEYLAQALRSEAEYRQIAYSTGDVRILDMAAREKQRFLAEIDRLADEKYDAELGGKSAFGIAAHPGDKPPGASKH